MFVFLLKDFFYLCTGRQASATGIFLTRSSFNFTLLQFVHNTFFFHTLTFYTVHLFCVQCISQSSQFITLFFKASYQIQCCGAGGADIILTIRNRTQLFPRGLHGSGADINFVHPFYTISHQFEGGRR